jgi:hypothetical protein
MLAGFSEEIHGMVAAADDSLFASDILFRRAFPQSDRLYNFGDAAIPLTPWQSFIKDVIALFTIRFYL